MNDLPSIFPPGAEHGCDAHGCADTLGGEAHFSPRGMLAGEIPVRHHHGLESPVGETPATTSRSDAHETPAAIPSPNDPTRASLDGAALSGEADRTPQPFHRADAPTAPVNLVCTDAEHREAEVRAAVCRNYETLRAVGYSLRQAAKALGKSPSWFSGDEAPFIQWKLRGLIALLPQRAACGAEPTVFPDLPEWFIPACRFFYQRTNRTAEAGSAPEAIRRAISLPLCPDHLVKTLAATLDDGRAATSGRAASHPTPSGRLGEPALPICPVALREAILAREKLGRDLLPARLMRQIPSSAPIMRATRSPRDAWLRYIESPGSLMLTLDEEGMERFLEPGEWWTIDDGTINFVCTVPLARPGDKCWDKFGVIAGRFQFLLIVDHRSYCITGFSYTARPRSSYRAEDLNATMHTAFAEHGRPRAMVMEKGISAANAITDALGLLGVSILRAASPHQKVVEGVFNKLWTKLSLERGQVGRFRGEEQETNNLLDSCRAGHRDPRGCFQPLAEVLRALREAIAEHNAQQINGRYGRWVPAEYFAAHAKKHLRPLEPDSAWIFSPVIAAGPTGAGLKVRSACMKTSVPLLPGFSQSFAFASPELHRWYGARVKLYFNPLAPDCRAKIVLAGEWRGTREGTVICDAVQIDRQARYTRRLLEYGLDPDIGKLAARQNALALNRHAQAVRPDRATVEPVIETRTGQEVTLIARQGAAGILPAESRSSGGTPEAPFDRASRLAELEAFERQNAALFG